MTTDPDESIDHDVELDVGDTLCGELALLLRAEFEKLQPGQVLKVDTGSVVGWQSTVQYDIQRAGNLKTSLFGGEGVFLTTLTGPGKVILQSMTLKNLAMSLQPFFAQQTSGGANVSLFG